MQFCSHCGAFLSRSMLRRQSDLVYVCSKCGYKNAVKEKIRGRKTVKNSRSAIEVFSKEDKMHVHMGV